MLVPQNRSSAEGSTGSWRAETWLAAGFVAGSLTMRLRNPRLTLLLAAGALAWRAFKPRPRLLPAPPPVLALPEGRVLEIIIEQPPCEIAESLVTLEEEPAMRQETITTEVLCMMLPPAPEALETSFPDALPTEEPGGGDAWILGLEPLPVVEELLPELPPSPLAAASCVQEHRPMIAEGAALPDMIEITIEPSAQGLSIIQSFSDAEPLSVHERPVEAATPEPVAAQVETKEKSELAMLSELVPVPDPAAEPPADINPSEAIFAEWGAAVENETPLTLRPMPRVIQWAGTQEIAVKPRKSQQPAEGSASPEPASADAAPATAVMEATRRIVPRAPASAVNAADQQKSWLNWWK